MSLSVNIKKHFKGFSLNVCFSTNKEYLSILGASGSGKSMTLKCIAGIETPDEGRIVLNDRVLFDSEKKINLKPQERNIGYLFQDYALFPNMTVEENIGAGLKLSKTENQKIIKEMIETFHLSGLQKKYPSQLSGGQQQRVALARCIAYKPDVLMLDEPFSALDSHLKEKLQAEVLEQLKYYKGEVLMVTHSRDEAYKLCKNLLIVHEGKSVVFGDTKKIFEEPQYLLAANITGCKNISKCEIMSPHSIYVVDWDIELKTHKAVSDDATHVGIQAHSFKISEAENFSDLDEEQNIMKCRVIKISEEMFEYSVLFENENKQSLNENSAMIFKVRKDEWECRKNKENLYIKIPQDLILLLK